MPVTSSPVAPVQERRQFFRSDIPQQVAVNLLDPRQSPITESVNVSEGGLCLRLQTMLEVRSLVRLQLTAETLGSRGRPGSVECTGRVAWVIQRLDLRDMPPFLFDVGIEFVDPPQVLRRFILSGRSPAMALLARHVVRDRRLAATTIRRRQYTPMIERLDGRPSRWHLVVSVDGTPCFSGHYSSSREAMVSWEQFKRRQARR